MLLKRHRCTLNLGSYSMLPKKPNAGFWCRQLRKLRKLTLVSYNHPSMPRYYKSYPAVVADRQRQIIEGGRYLLHPISKFSLYWEILMILVNLSHMTLSPLRLCFVLEPPGFKSIHNMDRVLLGLHVVCLVDIVVHFNTGYFTGENRQSVMDRSRIVWHYFRGFLVLDLLSSLPLAYVKLSCHEEDDEDSEWLLLAHLLPFLRIARIFTVMWDIKHFVKLCTRSYLVNSFIRHSILFLLIIHWFTCMLYLSPVLKSYINDEEARSFNFFLRMRGLALYKYSIKARYLKSLFICVSAFIGPDFSLFSVWEDDEIIMTSIIIVLASAFMSYIGVYTFRICMTHFNSSIRYNELMDQLEKYMRNKQFPESLKTRLLQLYQYHFQGQYFKEAEALNCLSDQLRHEISFYTCHKLVDKVKLFEGLTATLVGTILGCLKPEIYLRNDLLVRAGDIGECMYFIASGTVQVLSSKGAEVCHLMDGAHFGEVALLMRDSKRVATIIALETTLVYRLDIEDFQRFVTTNEALFSRIEELASHRMHDTVLLDEEFRREREHRADSDKHAQMDKSSLMEHSN